MEEIFLAPALRERGLGSRDLQRMRRHGELERVRRGAYITPRPGSPEEQHRRLIEATLPQLREPGVVSHVSAAVLHGLPVWGEALHRVHLTRTRTGGGKTRTCVQIHSSPLAADEIVQLAGGARDVACPHRRGPWPTAAPRPGGRRW